jgi:hypothetical protein
MRRPPTQFLKPVTQAEFEGVYGGSFEISAEGCHVLGWYRSPDGRVLGSVLCWSDNCWGLALVRKEALGIWCVCRWNRGLATKGAANLLLQVAAQQILEQA